ncbi:MAG: dienelactone hydrolase family protein, partial [Pseudomonadota bacterium]
YGDGETTEEMEVASGWMGALMQDRADFLARFEGALAALKAAPEVDEDRTAAIGYCLGGKAVLDLARSGADVAAVVSLHGVYDPPPGARGPMKASVLLLHGWDDPLATPKDVEAIAAELTETCEDWSLLAFGGTGHAYTNPANAPAANGMGYVKASADRSWEAMTRFLEEKLG